MAQYKPINLPQRIIKIDDTLAIRLQENFDEIERQLNRLQKYENSIGVPVNNTVDTNTDATGKWLTDKLSGAIDTAKNIINSGGGTVIMDEGNGILIVDDAVTPTKAMRMVAGGFAIADSKDAQGNWIWRTFGTGSGFTADELISGTILSSLINIVGNGNRLKLDGDAVHSYNSSGSETATFGAYETLAAQTATFTRASVAYKQDGTQVASGVPRYEYGAFYPADPDDRAIMVEEGTTNLLKNASFEVYTGATGVADGWGTGVSASVTASFAVDTTVYRPSGAKSQKVAITASTGAGEANVFQNNAGTAGTVYTQSRYVHGSVTGTAIGFIRLVFFDSAGVNLGITEVTFIPTSTWQRVSVTATAPTGTATIRAAGGIKAQVANDTGTLYFDDAQLEAKPYATSIIFANDTTTQAARAAEVLAIPSTVFTKGNWAVELSFTPTSAQNKVNNVLLDLYIDANNRYLLYVLSTGYLRGYIISGGVIYSIIDTSVMQVGTTYKIMFAGNGSVIRLCRDGAQIGNDLAYVEPVGVLPANIYIGSNYLGKEQANGLIDDTRFSNKARTLAEHQAYVASGAPLKVDDYTTYKMGFDGTLKPTVKKYGLIVYSGEIRGTEIYSSSFKTASPDKYDTYIELTKDGQLKFINPYGNPSLTISAAADKGTIDIYDNGTKKADMFLAGNTTRELMIETLSSNGIYLSANTGEYIKLGPIAGVTTDRGVKIEPGSGDCTVYGNTLIEGNANVSGVFTAGNKLCTEKTSQGVVGFFTRESPEQRYIDEGRAELVNGQCIIDLLDIEPFSECIEQESDLTKWHVHLTPIGKFTPYVVEIYDSYIAVASIEPGVNGKFTWSLSAIRKNKSGVRFPKMEWLVGGDEENDPVLLTNWEDGLLREV